MAGFIYAAGFATVPAAPSSFTPQFGSTSPKDEQRQLPDLERSAQAAQGRINSDARLREAFVKAVKSNDRGTASKLLVEAGFKNDQVNSAKLELVDRSRGGGQNPSEFTVTITISCCPLKIKIVVR